MVGLDIRGDRWGEHVRTWIAGLKALAEIGGGDVFMHGLQQMDAASLLRCQAQRREVRQRIAGAAHHDPLCKFQQALRVDNRCRYERYVARSARGPLTWR